VEPPAATHELSVAKAQSWLDATGRTPREQAAKVNLRQLFGRRRRAGLCDYFFLMASIRSICWK
jgi:hypothetical protein